MGLEIDKLKCFDISPHYSLILQRIPLKEYLEKVIFGEEDDFAISPEDDKRLKNSVRIFLAKEICPPMIYVHIDDAFAAQYSYFGSDEFSRKSNEDVWPDSLD